MYKTVPISSLQAFPNKSLFKHGASAQSKKKKEERNK